MLYGMLFLMKLGNTQNLVLRLSEGLKNGINVEEGVP